MTSRASRRRLPPGGWGASLLAAACILTALPAPGIATEPYPARPVRVIVAFAPGGAMDTVARLIGRRLEETLGQPFVVEDRPGASGNIASDAAAKAPADGYTLLVTANAVTVLPSTHGARAVDPVRAFAPITKLASQPIIITVNPMLGVDTLPELIALARRSPSMLAYGTAGVGTTDHLAAAMLCTRAGIEMVHVPYTNTGQEIKDLATGEVKISFLLLASAAPFLKSGQIRALAVTGQRRIAALPNVPTVAEVGYPDFDVASWYGLVAPAGTPKPIVDLLYREVARILREPEIREKLAAMGMEAVGSTPEQFADEIRMLVKSWPAVVKAAGILPN